MPVRKAAAENARLLDPLVDRGFELGVVSNGRGNAEKPAAISDISLSSLARGGLGRVGLFKPDPAIYLHACRKIRVASPPPS